MRSTVEQVSSLRCGASICTLVFGKCARSTVGRVSALYSRTIARAVLSSYYQSSYLSSNEGQVFPIMFEASVSALLLGKFLRLILGKCLRSTLWKVAAL
jgi:hypothetical protein